MNTIAQLRSGRIRGERVADVYRFMGIPYAAPPVGALHLRPPRPPAPWSGVRDALACGDAPWQPLPPPAVRMLLPDPATPGDDSLNLNVWTPILDVASLPVMVWLPGGMFEVCSGAAYDGERFARDGVVCVTINYRVGAEGFVHFGDGEDNLGLRDQIAALAWVRENIRQLGGDSDNVTVFGQSAGAMSIGALLAAPGAQGLFRRAIVQSGAAHTVLPDARARRITQRLAAMLGVPATREALAAIAPERLLATQVELKARILAEPDPEVWGGEVITTALPWQPVIDGDVLPAHPLARIAAGASGGVDLLVGTNTDDWSLFAMMNAPETVSDEVLTGPVGRHGFRALAAYGLEPERALVHYREARPSASPAELLAAVQTDWWTRVPAIRLADTHTSFLGRTYTYELAWPSPAFGGRFGACHALEIPFVFDTLDRGANQVLGALLGARPPQSLATAMHQAWVSFAASGSPGWAEYERGRRATMRFDREPLLVEDPRARERAFWEGVR